MITIITTPKPLGIPRNRIAFENAIRSWVRLKPRPEVLVFRGDDDRKIIGEEGGKWIGGIRSSVQGRPYFDHFISEAEVLASNDIIMYSTDHLILVSDLIPAVQAVSEAFPGVFVIIGKRWGLDVPAPISFSDPNWESILWDRVIRTNSLGGNAAKDYMIFRRPFGLSIPNFIMGYPWYDTWFVWAALQAGYPVIDASNVITVVHQSHGFVEGDVEAREITPGGQHNRRIGKSLNLDGMGAISQATYVLTRNGVEKRNG